MDKGAPVCVLFTDDEAEGSQFLYCELIQKARYGESFLVKGQGCKVGAYVLGEIETSPVDYYSGSGRYKNIEAARTATEGLVRNPEKRKTMKIAPYSGGEFDIILLFLRPEKAMRIIQAHAFMTGRPVEMRTGGIASICCDCTAYPLQGKIGISLGCKGSRKHSGYGEDEVVVGIPFNILEEIEEALGKIPGTHD